MDVIWVGDYGKKIMLKHEMSLLSCKLEDWITTDYSICDFMKYVRRDG